MAGWRDRARPVQVVQEQPGSAGGVGAPAGWRSRARSVGPRQSTVGAGEAVGRGVLQGVTMGFADELGAGIQAGLAKLSGDPEMQAGDVYRQARKENRGFEAKAAKDQGEAYLAGQVAGGLATAPVMPGGLAGAVAQGAVTGLGTSDADLTKGEIGGAALDTALGAGVGAAGYGVAKGAERVVGGLASKAAPALRRFAEQRALSAAGLMKGARKALGRRYGGDTQAAAAAGKVLLDEGVISPLAGFETVANRLGDVGDDAGRQIGNAARRIGSVDAPGVARSPRDLAMLVQREVVKPAAKYAGTAPQARAGQEIVRDLQRMPRATDPLPFEDLRALKGSFEGRARFDQATPAPTREAAQAAYKLLREEEDRYAQAVAKMVRDPELAQVLRDQRVRYGIAQDLQKAARDRAAGWGQNRVFSLTDNMAGMAGAVADGPRGLLMAALNKAFREVGPGAAAVGANAASKAAGKVDGATARRIVQQLLRTPEGQRYLREKAGQAPSR